MTGARQSADHARAEVGQTLADGRRRARGDGARPIGLPSALLALQRKAGNAAVSALLAAKMKGPADSAVEDIDGALKEIRGDDPEIETVEKGLKAAKATGVPVDLEGTKPPASALAVTMTGFGPEAVAPKKAVPPPKQVPAVSPLGKAAAKAHRARGGAGGRGGKAPAAGSVGGGPALALGPRPMSPDQVLQPPVAPTPVKPGSDPAFTQVTGSVKRVASAKRAHPPAASKAKEAQDAALAPTDDVAGQAKAAKVDSMDAQQPGTFDKKAFIAAVKAAIEAKSPKTLEEADDYTESGKAGEVKGEVKGLVSKDKDGESKDIETATGAPPDESKAVQKPVTPMAQESAGEVASIPAAGAVPKAAPAEQLNLEAGKHQANQEMADAAVTEPQLAESNEPEFQQTLVDKKAAADHADTAPGEFRQHEKEVIQQGQAAASAETKAGVAGMQGSKGAALAALVADKGKTKSKDETRRAEVTTKIQGIFTATETDVKKILDGIDPKVETAFEQGEARARSRFETYVAAKMSAYKEDRYGGWLGGLRWAKDKIFGMPDKVNEFYVAGRELYLTEMDKVISGVADIVGTDLMAAKARIAKGKTEIDTYVKTLPEDLKKVGAEASEEIGDKFEQLESDVDAKQDSVVDTLASKYVEARKGLDERIEALQAENKGLVDKVIGAIKAVINTIRELAAMLMNVLARVAGVVGDIIAHPIAFLGNLIDGVKGGILKFKDNILTHLRNGLMSWLFGALAEGGVEMPDTFDIKGIIKLLASLFGLTWRNIRSRIVKQIGEKAMGAVEKGVEIFQLIASEGVGGVWHLLVEKLGDIKDMILEQVKDFVITRIITAGITWLIGLLNPAAAFIKACKLIYDVIMFFVSNAGRILKFVNTVIDSVADIVKGNVSSVVSKIDDVLGQMVPIIIGFLASVIGLGGIGQKIRQIVETLQKPVNKALDFIIKTGLKLAGPVIRGITGISKRVKAKVAAGKAYVKGKVDAGKAYVKGKVDAGKQWVKGKAAAAGAGFSGWRDRLLGITFRRNFTANGEKHSVYSKKGSPGTLFTASQEEPTADSASPQIKELERQFRAVMDQYIAAASQAENDPAARQRGIQLHAQAEGILSQIVVASKDFYGSERQSAGDPGPMQDSRIGEPGRHGEREDGSSQRSAHPLHWLESEHVIPFAAGKSLWRALSLYLPWRGSPADNAQRTIMIYERAARFKTRADNQRSYAFEKVLAASNLHRLVRGGERAGSQGLDTAEARNALSIVLSYLEEIRVDAVDRTVDAVDSENRLVEPGSSKTNGQRRGNEPPRPDRGAITAVSNTQFEDITDLLNQEVAEREQTRDKGDRLRERWR